MTKIAASTITTDGTEQTIIDETTGSFFPGAFLFSIGRANQQAGDTVEVKVYRKMATGEALEAFYYDNFTGAPDSKLKHYESTPFVVNEDGGEFKITIKRTAGTDRTYSYQVMKL